MSRKDALSKARRQQGVREVNRAFALLDKGMRVRDVTSAIDQREMKGRYSQELIRRVLDNHPLVICTQSANKFDDQIREVDLVAVVEFGEHKRLGVKIQVKSSEKGRVELYERKAKQFGLKSAVEVEKKLMQKNRCVLVVGNPGDSEEKIVGRVRDQFDDWIKKKTG